MSARDEQKLKELYEFGPFRVDADKEILLRAGEPIPLQPKTFQILLVLIRHSQEIVTKEDLMKAVWPDTFVEEANLSRNIFILRKALAENPPEQRYIITVPGRGYRLAENVRLVLEQEVSIIVANRSKVQVEVTKTRPWARALVATLVALAVAVGIWRFFRHPPLTLTEKDTVVLADFTNSTGNPVFEGTLRQGLAVQLEQSPLLSLVSDDRVHQTLKLMGRPIDAPLASDTAREVCERTGSAAVLEGSIASLGSQYVLGLRAKNCRTGEILDEEQVQATRKEDVLNALSQIASRFRSRIGESLATVKKHDIPLQEATTPSLEALKAYSEAWKIASSTGPADAVPLLQRAIHLDPNFAMAHAFLGRVYGDIWEPVLSAESTSKAYVLRNRTSDRERFFIEVSYDLQMMGNLGKAQETGELWAQTYPRDQVPHGFLSWISQEVGKYGRRKPKSHRA